VARGADVGDHTQKICTSHARRVKWVAAERGGTVATAARCGKPLTGPGIPVHNDAWAVPASGVRSPAG
jgi:hypothetical protein